MDRGMAPAQGAGGQVIAALDASLSTRDVCRHAAWAAARLAAPLACVHVVEGRQARARARAPAEVLLEPGATLLDEAALLEASLERTGEARGRLLLQQAALLAGQAGDLDVRALMGHGALVDVLGALVADAALVVMGRRGEHSEFGKTRIGSQVERVVRRVDRPLLVVPRGFAGIRTVLVAFEGSERGRRRLEWVARSPLFAGLDIRLLTVGDATARPALDQALESLAAAGLRADGRVVHGDPEEVLGQHAEAIGADLLVMGAYGRSRLRQLLLGSTTSMVLQASRIPVLLLR